MHLLLKLYLVLERNTVLKVPKILVEVTFNKNFKLKRTFDQKY